MTIVTIIGIERPLVLRPPNGIKCDVCGTEQHWDRKDWQAECLRLIEEGWSLPDKCPKCKEPS